MGVGSIWESEEEGGVGTAWQCTQRMGSWNSDNFIIIYQNHSQYDQNAVWGAVKVLLAEADMSWTYRRCFTSTSVV